MPDRWDVIPHVRQVESSRVEPLSVTAVVLDIAAAMTAFRDGNSRTIEYARFTLRVVQQAVMRRVQPAWDRQCRLDVDRNPVTECQLAGEKGAEVDIPLRKVVDEQATAWF